MINIRLSSMELVRAVEVGAIDYDEGEETPYHIARHIFVMDENKLRKIKKMLREAHLRAEDESDVTGEAGKYVLTTFLLPYVQPQNPANGAGPNGHVSSSDDEDQDAEDDDSRGR